MGWTFSLAPERSSTRPTETRNGPNAVHIWPAGLESSGLFTAVAISSGALAKGEREQCNEALGWTVNR